MIDYEGLRKAVVNGLRNYLDVPIVRSNQNAEMPKYPYVSYTIITLASSKSGTYGEYEDGCARKPVTSSWSFTALSDDNIESVTLANKARDWLDRVGDVFLSDNDVVVQSVGNITNRDNILTSEYEYRNGFDAVFWLYDEIKDSDPAAGIIETMEIGDDLASELAARLDGVVYKDYEIRYTPKEEAEEIVSELKERMNGV